MGHSSHRCAVPICNYTCQADHLMCAPHWHQVPADIQRWIYQTYRTSEHALRHNGRSSAEFRLAFKAWLDAAQDAIQAVLDEINPEAAAQYKEKRERITEEAQA